MYNSQYYTCEQIDERLLQGYLDDYNEVNNTNLTKDQFHAKLGDVLNTWNGIDNTPLPQSHNLVSSEGIYEFVRTNSIGNINSYSEIPGYIASSSHFQHIPEGTVVYDDSRIYFFTNLIELKPNTYRITTGCSTNAIAISEWDKEGNFVQSLYDGTGNNVSDHILTITSTKYIRICKHVSINISIAELIKAEFIQESGNTYRFGYVASDTNADGYSEGEIVGFDREDVYIFSNPILISPGSYRIKSKCSSFANVLSKCDSRGKFLSTLIKGDFRDSLYLFKCEQTSYVILCGRKGESLYIDLVKPVDIQGLTGISINFGYVASDTNADGYSEGEIVGFGKEDVYIFSNPILISPGIYIINSACSSSANVLSSCDLDGNFISTLIKGGNIHNNYIFRCTSLCYVLLCGREDSLLSINQIDNSIYVVDNGVSMRYGYIKTNGTVISSDLPNPDGNFYYLHSDLIVLDEGEIIRFKVKCSASASVLSKWTYDNNFVENLITGNGVITEYTYQASERMCVKICTRNDVVISFDRIKSTRISGNLGIVPVAWNWGYVQTNGELFIQNFPDFYRYSQIITLKAGIKYRIALTCSANAIPVSKWVNGIFDSVLFTSPDAYRKRYYEITPETDMDVRFCGREITDENAVLWYQSTYSDHLAGKVINFLGDSYVANHELNFNDSWQYKMCKEHNIFARNYGINGNGIVAGNNPMVSRYVNMNDDADYVIVIGGKNDYNHQISLIDFKSGLVTLINGLISKYIARGTKIAFFTPWRVYLTDASDPQSIKLQQYVDAMVEVCNQYSVPIFDSSRKSSVFMYNSSFRSNYCQNSTDISHLNAAGHDYFLNKAESFIKSL